MNGQGCRPSNATPHLGTCVARQLEALLRLYASTRQTADRVRHVFEILTDDSLDRPAAPPFEGLSFINADGLPFQWVFRFDRGTTGWGFLCEAGRPAMGVAARFAHTLGLVDEACAATGGVAPTFLDAVTSRLMPAATEAWPAHWTSALWAGVAIKGDSVQLRPYFNINRGPARDRWLRVGWVLKELGRLAALERLCALSSRCSQDSWPAGLAIDIRPDGDAGRIKVYFRSAATTPAWLARWYDALELGAQAASIRRLLDLLGRTGRESYPPSAFILSLEIHADERVSLKTDLAVTKWMATDAAIVEGSAALASSLGQHPRRLTEALRAVGSWPPDRETCAATRFVGLGCEPDGSQHVNVYVEPAIRVTEARAPHRRGAGRSAVRQAVERGVDVLSASLCNRHWQDFSLPVGASDAWVTAYVLAKMAELPRHLLGSHLRSMEEALEWLTEKRTASGGWGYNSGVPDDADSTAWAILALRSWRRRVPGEALAFLQSCLCEEGHVTTYPARTSPAPGWSRAAPDVTAVALRALHARPRGPALRYFSRRAASDGLIPAYWWASPLYTRSMLFETWQPAWQSTANLRRTITEFQPAGSFERALLVRCRLGLGLSATALARELVAAQNTEGGWTPSARLRLTRPDVAEPWAVIDAGPLFTDDRGVFTTATVVAALGRSLQHT